MNDALFVASGNVYAGDQILAPYVALKEYFSERGIPVHTIDLIPAPSDNAQRVYISFGMRERAQQIANRPDVIASAFFAMECPIVEPALYRALPGLQSTFKRIYSWSDSESLMRFTRAPLELEPFYWPQSFDQVHDSLWRRRDRKFLAMMNSNKLPVLNTDELYRKRVECVEYFERFGEMDLYGRGWDGPPFRLNYGVLPGTVQHALRGSERVLRRFFPDPSLNAARRAWKGAAESKSETLSQYKFAICFENSILRGWITEKIFDCFFVGTVPVYWGAPEIAERVPPESFVDMRNFNSFEELRNFLKSLSDAQIADYRDSARAYIESTSFDPFRKETFVDVIKQIVEEDCGVSLDG